MIPIQAYANNHVLADQELVSTSPEPSFLLCAVGGATEQDYLNAEGRRGWEGVGGWGGGGGKKSLALLVEQCEKTIVKFAPLIIRNDPMTKKHLLSINTLLLKR